MWVINIYAPWNLILEIDKIYAPQEVSYQIRRRANNTTFREYPLLLPLVNFLDKRARGKEIDWGEWEREREKAKYHVWESAPVAPRPPSRFLVSPFTFHGLSSSSHPKTRNAPGENRHVSRVGDTETRRWKTTPWKPERPCYTPPSTSLHAPGKSTATSLRHSASLCLYFQVSTMIITFFASAVHIVYIHIYQLWKSGEAV